MKIEKTFTLSSYETHYETQEFGIGHTVRIGHTVNGEKPKKPSFAETLNPLCNMIDAFKDLPTGTKIKVTMESK